MSLVKLYADSLEQQLSSAQQENDYLKGLLDAFWTGDVPNNATFDHMILAKYGRIRLLERAKKPALLTK